MWLALPSNARVSNKYHGLSSELISLEFKLFAENIDIHA